MNTTNSNFQFKNLWVIDDNEIDLYLAQMFIEEASFAEEISLFNSPLKALELLKCLENKPEQLPQFIFLDIRMPVMDGFEFLTEYDKFPDSIKLNCIVIMLSSSLDPNDQRKIENNSLVKQFLSKPLSEETLGRLKKEFK